MSNYSPFPTKDNPIIKPSRWKLQGILIVLSILITVLNYHKLQTTGKHLEQMINLISDNQNLQNAFISLEIKKIMLNLKNSTDYHFNHHNQYHHLVTKIENQRKSALLSAHEHRKALLKAAGTGRHDYFYKNVIMEAYCKNIERIGGAGDGGKFVCNPGAVRDNCTLMSLGLNNQIEYDEHIFRATRGTCTILGADQDLQSTKTMDKYKKINGKLYSGQIPQELSIPSIMDDSGENELEMLKIDIEMGEITALEPLLSDYFVCQIFIELHGSTNVHLRMLQMMAKYGFRVFSMEPNPLCTECCEYSLINDVCMAQFGAVPLAVTIPFP